MTLVEFLEQNGYTRVPLSKSGIGHFHTDGTLSGRALSVLVDTGAASTVFSLDIAREMGLRLSKLEMMGGGAGAAQLDVYGIREARFRLGKIFPQIAMLLAMDLSHVNQAAALRRSGPIDAVLGADVLNEHSAVIDYGSNSLYLKL